MQYIPTNIKINLEWTVKKGIGNEAEDFGRSRVYLFLASDKDRWSVPCEAGSTGKVTAELPETLPEGVYHLELVWYKNENTIEALRAVQRTRKTCVFAIDSAISVQGSKATLRLETVASTYGYDGLSAYEIAVLRGKTSLSEEEWLDAASKGTAALDTLESYDKNVALSANKGRELAERLQAQQTQYQDLSAELNNVRDSLDGKLAALIANAPEELNTLKEVADYIAEDMEQRRTMQNSIASLLWGSATFAVTGGGVKHVGTNVPITITATFTSAELIPESIVITDKTGTEVQTVNNSKTASYSGNLNDKVAGDYAFNGKATIGSNVKTAKTIFQLRNKIYCGMGKSYTEVAKDDNALTPKTTAGGTYSKTASANGQRFFLLVPADVTAPSKDKFVSGGAPVAIIQTSQTIGDISYKVFQTEGEYLSGVSLTISC